MNDNENNGNTVEDQADLDANNIALEKERRRKELLQRSQVIQRNLPRPVDINTTVLRPSTEMQGLSDLQRAEELIKQEMVTMLHYDALHDPVTVGGLQQKRNLSSLAAFLEQNSYDDFNPKDLTVAQSMLKEEMQHVKNGMGHGELSLESYSQVWQECLSQVLYLPSQNRYTRANLASKKDRIESSEKKLEQNRKHMAKEAKRCGKIEKKLKMLMGGYQVIKFFYLSTF